MFTNLNKRAGGKGFTLIELLVVIAIIGVLASIVLASLNSARRKSRDARRIADIKQIQLALELYFDANGGTYPNAIYVACAAQGTPGPGNPLCPTYIPTVPCDPLSTGTNPTCSIKYQYAGLSPTSVATCSSYHLGATLEESTNPALNNDIDAPSIDSICTSSGANFAGTDPVYDVKP